MKLQPQHYTQLSYNFTCQLDHQFRLHTEDHVRAQLWNQLWASFRDQIGQHVDSQLTNHLRIEFINEVANTG